MNNIKQTILEQIHTGTLTARPRWQFMLETALLLVGVTIVALTSIYLFSFIVFIISVTDAVYAPSFGMRGMISFLLSVPWTILILGLLFLTILEFLVRRFSFAYQKPLLYSVITIIVVTILGSYGVVQTAMHEYMNKSAAPFVGMMYKGYSAKPPRDLYIGTIIMRSDTDFTMNDKRRGNIQVNHSNHGRSVGETVMVFGRRDADGIVLAKEIRTVSMMATDTPPMMPVPIHMQPVR